MDKESLMITLATLAQCTGCTACKVACPKQAIGMMADKEGFLRPHIDATKCIQCHACERACPVLHPGDPDETPTCYAARTKDDALRLASSSGGLFTELARPILAKGGVVFGCVWEKPALVAIHAKAETEDALAEMRGSKYVQSDLRDTYREVKVALEKGRDVLFSGTPCQIAGLKRYLGKVYDHLLTVEIICHGAPSPDVFKTYKQELAKRFGDFPVNITFRNKDPSWKQCSLVSTYTDARAHREDLYDNPYVKAFLRDLCLRPSCYDCQAKGGRSGADITIADFWGIEKVCPALDDDRGTSAVLLHTQKGLHTWEALQGVEFKPVVLNDILRGNPSYIRSVVQPRARQRFMRRFRNVRTLASLVRRCQRGPWFVWMVRRCLGKVKRILKKVLGL